MTDGKQTFVLVHGAWHGSWCWKRVRNKLTSLGHAVFTPTLSGLAERSHLLSRDIDLETHIADVVNLIRWEELADIVLCGHSYGGLVITGAADRVANRVRSLVYLDAFVPGNGENLWQHIPNEQSEMLMNGANEVGEGWKVPPIPAEVFNVNENDRAWVNSQCTLQPIETLRQGVQLTGDIDSIGNVHYIRAAGFEEGSPFGPFEEQARTRGWNVKSVDCGHDVMLDEPDWLVDALLAAAS